MFTKGYLFEWEEELLNGLVKPKKKEIRLRPNDASGFNLTEGQCPENHQMITYEYSTLFDTASFEQGFKLFLAYALFA